MFDFPEFDEIQGFSTIFFYQQQLNQGHPPPPPVSSVLSLTGPPRSLDAARSANVSQKSVIVVFIKQLLSC